MAQQDPLRMLDSLISDVQSFAASNPGTAQDAKTGSAPTLQAVDPAFWPIVPRGHTAFTWGLEGRGASAPSAPLVQSVPGASSSGKAGGKGNNNKGKNNNGNNSKGTNNKGKNKGNNKGKNKGGNNAESKEEGPLFSKLDIVVGQVVDAKIHENADRCYVEMIDLGEEEPRQVVSGIREHIPLDEFKGSRLFVVRNLKKSKIQKVESFGMILAVKSEGKVELLQPPANAKVGDRMTLDGADYSGYTVERNIKAASSRSTWAKVKDDLKVVGGVGTFQGQKMTVNGELCTAPSLQEGVIS